MFVSNNQLSSSCRCQISTGRTEYNKERRYWQRRKVCDRLDDRIVEQLVRNPEKGLALLMDRYMGLVYAIVSGKLNAVCGKEDIEECVSEVFWSVFRSRASIDTSRSSLKTFVALVAKRKAISRFHASTGARQQVVHADEAEWHDVIDPQPSAADQVGDRETKEALIAGIRALGEPDSQIMIRKFYLGQSSKEIAATLRLKVNTVDKKVSRGLAKLKTLLKGVL